MKKIIENFIRIGVESTVDSETIKKIRLSNSMSIVAISTAVIVSGYILILNSSILTTSIVSLTLISTIIPPLLNHYHKHILARTSFILLAIIDVIVLSIVFGNDIDIHLFLFALFGFPFILLEYKLKLTRYFLSFLIIISYFFLEWYTMHNPPIIALDDTYTILFRILNTIMIFIMIYALYYFFILENRYHIKKLEHTSEKLNAKNHELEQFANIVSHDLNEPIRTVNSFLEIIKEEYHDAKNQEISLYFSHINRAISRMQTMLENLLKYAKLSKNLVFKNVDLNKIIHDIKIDINGLITKKRVLLSHSELPMIACAPIKLKQVFQNLIINAIKYQKPNQIPIIHISYEKNHECYTFCIADNGIGIPTDKRDEIFQMFNKLHKTDQYEGEGIGLAFCKKIIELHGGSIWVRSQINEGSQFYFTIPVVTHKE